MSGTGFQHSGAYWAGVEVEADPVAELAKANGVEMEEDEVGPAFASVAEYGAAIGCMAGVEAENDHVLVDEYVVELVNVV